MIIKLVSLYALIVALFGVLPTALSAGVYDGFWIMSSVVLPTSILLFLLLLFLFKKTDVIIDFLKLDKGFDTNEISIGNFDLIVILQVALMVIGLQLIIDYGFDICYEVILYFKNKISHDLSFIYTAPSVYDWSFRIVKVVLGFILIFNMKFIAEQMVRIGGKKNN